MDHQLALVMETVVGMMVAHRLTLMIPSPVLALTTKEVSCLYINATIMWNSISSTSVTAVNCIEKNNYISTYVMH